jgi:hypothetical protein
MMKLRTIIAVFAASAAVASPAAAEGQVYYCVGERHVRSLNESNCVNCGEKDPVRFVLKGDWSNAQTDVKVSFDEMTLECDPTLISEGRLSCREDFFGVSFDMDLDTGELTSGSVDVYAYASSNIAGSCELF